MKLKLTVLALLAVGIFSCNKYKTTTFEDGSRILVHEKGESGKLPEEGDIIQFDLEIRTSSDSLIQSTVKNGAPFTAPIQKGNFFKGSFENALFHIGEGDSATVFVSADTLFKQMGQEVPKEIGAGSDIRFTVKMHKVKSEEEFKKSLLDDVKDYVSKNLKGATKSPEGDVYYTLTNAGSGDNIKNGDEVTVNYVGKFLNGQIFDQGEGLKVTVGGQQVIPGWEMALRGMKKGSKGTCIIPSDLAYGERGAGPIAPFTPIVFDMEVVEVVKK